jgi:hypothetical protein
MGVCRERSREESISEAMESRDSTPESTPGEPMTSYMSNYQNHLHVCCWEQMCNVRKVAYEPNVVFLKNHDSFVL